MSVTILKMPSFTVIRDAEVNGTAEKDVMGRPCTLHHVHLRNVGASALEAWVKLYDDVNPTIGTTIPNEVYQVESSSNVVSAVDRIQDIPINPPDGLPFSEGFSFACVTEGGGTAGTTDPNASDVVEAEFLVVED